MQLCLTLTLTLSLNPIPNPNPNPNQVQLCLGTWRRHGQQGAPLVFSSCCAAEAGAEAEAGGGKSGCPGAQLFEALGEQGQPRQLRFAGGRGDVCVTAPISK